MNCTEKYYYIYEHALYAVLSFLKGLCKQSITILCTSKTLKSNDS